MERFKVTAAPGLDSRTASTNEVNLAQQPLEVDGTIYLPGDTFEIATKQDPEGAAYVVVCIALGKMGLAQQFTADYARTIGKGLIACADRADAHLQKVAAAKLDAALAKRGQP